MYGRCAGGLCHFFGIPLIYRRHLGEKVSTPRHAARQHHKEYFSYSKTVIEGRALATDSESLLALIQKHKSQAVSLGDEEAPGEENISRG